MLKMNDQSKNIALFLSPWKVDIFQHSFNLTDYQCCEIHFISAEGVKRVASPVEIVDNTEAQC